MRLIINTLASYSRTVIGIVFVLFSSRWVLATLGVSDFGIYSLIGSILAIVVFLNTILANGNSRFLSIAIGEDNESTLRSLFKTMVVIHTIIPIIALIMGYYIGIYAIHNWFEIPINRLDSTVAAFQVAIIASFFAMIAVPYTASYIANQNIVTYSLISLFQSFLYFVSAYLLRFFHGDSLVTYAYFMAISNILVYSLLILIAIRKYPYCRSFFTSSFNCTKAVEIIKFTFWNFLGSFGHLCRTQGISIIVNLKFGTPGNAALGIANQVATQSANLTNALGSATSPEVYKRIGSGDFEGANKLCNSISKFGTCLILLLSSVIIANLDDLLMLWLKNVPPYSSELCVCFILMYIFEKIPMGQNTFLSGINKISTLQTLTLICYLMSIVFPYLGFTSLFGITGIGISCAVSMLMAIHAVLYCYNSYTNYNYSKQFTVLLILSSILYVITLLTKYINSYIELPMLAKLIISSILMVVVVSSLFYYVIYNQEEKKLINNIILKLCRRK